MKTKTIYHLDQDCNIVRIEVITKQKKRSYQPIDRERLMEILPSGILKNTAIPQDETQKQHQPVFQKTPPQKELSIDQLRDKLFPGYDNSNKNRELVEFLLQSTSEVRLAVQLLEQVDKKYRHQLKNDLRQAGRNVASEATNLIWTLERVLPKLLVK